jgi:histidinol-phosphate/aromatic aminotransferase/cobyric acid decarboxylase-like protein
MSGAPGERLPPAGLAVASWGTPAGAQLDLRYLPDEADWLDPRPADVWRDVIGSSPGFGASLAESYPVDDPYGGTRGAPAVGRFFDVALDAGQVTFGAGVTALLHGLAGLAAGGGVVAHALVHPDLEAWAAARGTPVTLAGGPLDADGLIEAVERARPALVHFDRPAFGNEVLSLADVERVARAAAAAGAAVVVDEAPAPYLGAAASAIRLVHEVDNVVVLRGFTKAYSLGGLRAGFAVASRTVAPRVRAVVPPLQVGEPALAVALALLDAGDPFARLRERIRATKPRSAALLEAAGLELRTGDADVPALVVDDSRGAAAELLERRGVAVLRPSLAPGAPPEAGSLAHLRTPIDDERIDLLGRLLGTPAREPSGVGAVR